MRSAIELVMKSKLSVAPAVRRPIAAVVTAVAVIMSAPVGGADIPWDPELRYSRTSVDDDLRNVLRSLLKANGLAAVFAPGVDARVSFRFDQARPSIVFQKLIAAHDLSYSYDPAAKSVTIKSNRVDLSSTDDQRFLTLDKIDYQTLRDALERFGIALTGLAYEPRLGLLSIRGPASHVERVEKLIEALEARAAQREREYFERANRRRLMNRAR